MEKPSEDVCAVAGRLFALHPCEVHLLRSILQAETISREDRFRLHCKCYALKEREIEIIQRLILGLKRQAVAWELGLSIKTIDFHLGRAFHRLNCHTASHAIALLLS